MALFGPKPFTLRDGREVTLRNLVAADAERFAPFMDTVARESTHTLQYVGRQPLPDQAAKIWTEGASSPDTLFLGAFSGDRLVALLNVKKIQATHPWLSHIAYFSMMLVQDFWGQGLGRAMLGEMDAFARSIGVTRIEANVRVANTRGLELYQKAGFEIEGLRRRAARIDGEYVDEHYISKLLD